MMALVAGTGRRGDRRGANRPGGGGPGVTDEPAELLDTPPADGDADREMLRRAHQIAARLAVPRPRRDITARRGIG